MPSTAEKVCAYRDCDVPIQRRYTVCKEHYSGFTNGALDECPGCGMLKDTTYEQCLVCYRQSRPKAPRTESTSGPAAVQTGQITGQQRWKDDETKAFYVYLLELDDNGGGAGYYAGITGDLQSRKLEHQQGRTKSTAGSKPRLVWFPMLPSRAEAAEFEKDLWSIIHADNPRPLTRLVTQFRNLLREVDNV